MRSHLPCAAILGALSLAAVPGTAAATCDAPLETPPDVYALLEALLAGAGSTACPDPGPDEALDAMVDLAMTSCPIGWDCEPRATPPTGEPVAPPLIPTVVVDPPIPPEPPIIVDPSVIATTPPPIVIYPPLPPDTLPPPPITIEPPPPVLPPVTTEPPPPPPIEPPDGDCKLGAIRIWASDTGEPIAVDLVPCGEATYDWWFGAPWIVVADDAGPFVPLYRVDPNDGLAIIASHNQAALIAQDVIDAQIDVEHIPATETVDELDPIDADRVFTHVLIDASIDGALTVLTGGG